MRTYYRNRMFMGICCISCEVLYLSVSTAAAARLVLRSKQDACIRYGVISFLICGECRSWGENILRSFYAVMPPAHLSPQKMAAAGIEVICAGLHRQACCGRSSNATGFLWCPQLYALDWKQFRVWPLLAIHLPQSLLQHVPKSAGCDRRHSALHHDHSLSRAAAQRFPVDYAAGAMYDYATGAMYSS